MKKSIRFSLLAAALSGSYSAHAQSVWTGTGTTEAPALWSDPGNWSAASGPADNATVSLTFLNSALNSVSTNDRAGLAVTGINVPANDGVTGIKDNTVSGNPITLSGDVTVATGNWQRFNLPIVLSGNRGFAINTGITFLGGALSGTASIAKTGAGELVISGSNSFGGGNVTSVGDERLTINSTSTVTLEGASSLGAPGGYVRFANGQNGNLTVRNDAAMNDFSLTAGSSGNAVSVTLARRTAGPGFSQPIPVLNFGSRSISFNQGGNVASGFMTASIGEIRMTAGNNERPVLLGGSAAMAVGPAGIGTSNSTRRLQLDGTSPNNSIAAITNNLSGFTGSTLHLIKSNSSTWVLTAANSYSGTTEVNGGTLQLGNGGGTGSLPIGNTLTVGAGAVLAINRSNPVTQGVDFPGPIIGSGALRKQGAGNLILSAANSLGSGAAAEVLTFVGGGSGTVTLKDPAALGAAGNVVRFSGGGSGVLDLQTDTSVNAYGIASGAFNGGTLIANRATPGGPVTHNLGTLELSSVTMTINTGGNVSGAAGVGFTEVRMSGGNDLNPVTIAGDADITIGSASINNNGLAKRLRLDGTSANNRVTGVITDTANGVPNAKVSLIKSNSGAWRLQGLNSYTGDTTVSAGTLEIDQPYLNDTATLRVDGVLKLNHGATDVVGELVLGGLPQQAGVYHAGNSGGFITGSGSIEVLPSSDFASWAQSFITDLQPGADATVTGDPDGDGTSNLAEFGFRGNPLDGSDNGIVAMFTEDSSDAGNERELVLTVAIRAGNPAAFGGSPLQLVVDGVTYSIEGSADLSSFGAAVSEVAPLTAGLPDLSGDPDYQYRSFRLDSSNGLTGKGFLRAKVEQ